MKNGDRYVWHFFSFTSDQITIKSDRLPDNETLSLHLNWSQNKLHIHDSFLINWCVNEKRDEAVERETRNENLLTGF